MLPPTAAIWTIGRARGWDWKKTCRQGRNWLLASGHSSSIWPHPVVLREENSPTRRQSLDTGWRNYRRPELHAISEKGRCAATSSRGGSCRRRPTDPQRLGRRATLPRCDLPQTPLPQSTSALSPPVTHRFPRRGFLFFIPKLRLG